jgi:hypothetical protein
VTAMTSHAGPKTARTPGLWAAWAVLIAMGGTSVTYNVWHATHGGHMPAGLALLYGLAPVLAAILLSHIVAEHDGGKGMQAVTFVIMLAAMSLSAYATAVTVAPAAGPVFAWVFGLTLDAAALVALRVILASRSRKGEAAAEREAAHAELAAARGAVQQATAETAKTAAEFATVRAELGAELDRTRAELEAVRAAVPQGGPRKRSAPVPKDAKTAPVDDVALEARALELLATDLDMTGAELGRRLGVTPGYGRKLRRRLTDPDRPMDRSGSQQEDRPPGRPGDR